ncbi:BRAP2 RING ZnF UBP domain-containing protein 2 isoform X2 [Cryptomeria japonica]|uniref:BRAP2 RING ZnF UBP domain-containing protein 2 isoform X2 n=1 Tax=Cryptomeria japonica TaxID=3369 RepID=UPI0027DA75EB|nr:BRAP2 RING ZnF UBP domain-containing protein 2 isoform X2 [Cryptomeria japonica]
MNYKLCNLEFMASMTVIMALVKNPIDEEYDLSRLQLKAIMTAAGLLTPDLQRAFHEKFPGVELSQHMEIAVMPLDSSLGNAFIIYGSKKFLFRVFRGRKVGKTESMNSGRIFTDSKPPPILRRFVPGIGLIFPRFERLDQHISGILTTVCNHSFHSTCMSKWTDSSCPVCRYCQQQLEKSTCSVCSTSENLWICVICGFVGCGRYKSAHAINHWKETQHCYSLELETQRVWDYVGDNYVHRLIQSKTDGKLVELNTHCRDVGDECGRCECSHDSGFESVLYESKMEAIADEYNKLLTSQLENQRQYYDSLLAEAKQQRDAAISEAIEKTTNMKVQKLQAKLEKCTKENEFLSEVNKNLIANQELWKKKVAELEKRDEMATKVRDEKIADLEEQVRDLMVYIEGKKTLENCSNSDEIKDGTILPMNSEATSKINRRLGKSTRKKR